MDRQAPRRRQHGGAVLVITLVFGWAWEDAEGRPGHETLVTVSFAGQGAKTKLTLHQAIFTMIGTQRRHRGVRPAVAAWPVVDSGLRRTTIWRSQPCDHDEEEAMKYLCLVYYDEKTLDAMPKSEFEAFSDAHVALDEELRKSGHSIVAEALQPAHTATTVRVRNGKLSTTDGPFAETKEQLGGFYLIEARDLNDAIQAAARIPSARLGSIEVRPVWDLRQQEPRAGH